MNPRSRNCPLRAAFKKEAEKALAIDRNHEEAIGGLVDFYRRAPGIMGGDKKKSAQFADRLTQVNATAGWLLLADLAFDARDSVAGEQALRSAVAVKGEPRAKVALANWLVASWRKPEAIAEMQTALKMDPSLEGAKTDLKRLKS